MRPSRALVLLLGVHIVRANYMSENIIANLLDNFGSISIRPGLSRFGDNSPDRVEVQFQIDRLHNIDQKKQTWGATGFLRAYWKDPRLAFDATEAHTNVLSISAYEVHRLWQPDLYWQKIVAASDQSPTDGLGENFMISPDGSVSRSQQREFTIACSMDLKLMPFDTQTCTFTIALYSSTASDVILTWKANESAFPNLLEPTIAGACHKNKQWFPVAVEQRDLLQTFTQVSGATTYSGAEARVTFVRGAPWALFRQYFVISIFLVILSYSGSWINPAATPARVALGIITVLAVVTMMNSLSAQLPADVMTWLTEFQLTSLYFNLICFIEQVAVNWGMVCNAWLKAEEAKIKAEKEAQEAEEGGKKADEAATDNDDSRVDMKKECATAGLEEPEDKGVLNMGAAGATPKQVEVTIGATQRKPSSLKRAATATLNKTAAVVRSKQERIMAKLTMPVLRCFAPLRNLDFYLRIIFPFVYIPIILAHLSLVNFGRDWWARISAAESFVECD